MTVKICVLHDQVRPDADPDQLDNLVQAQEVASGLAQLGHEVCSVQFDDRPAVTRASLADSLPELVFNLVESSRGSGRYIHLAPALLNSLRLPYTGAGVRAMLFTSNKLLAKKSLRAAGLPTADWVSFRGSSLTGDSGVYIVKSVWEHASIGLGDDSIVRTGDPAVLRGVMADRRQLLGGSCFAEAFIDGREFNLAVLAGKDGPEVLPPAEILFEGYAEERPRVVDYRAKWETDSFEYNHTPRRYDFPPSDAPLLEELRQLSLSCWRLFDLRGWARVDFRVDGAGRPWILEVNANPCLSADAGFAAAVQRAGLEFSAALERIVADSGMNSSEARSRSGII